MTIQKLITFLEALQEEDGGFTSDNRIKATAEYLVIHRFCPHVTFGDTEKARIFLKDNLSVFASFEVRKGFKLMERILQISAGIPEDTAFLSEKFLDLSVSCVSVSVKSSLLLVLFFQNIENNMIKGVLEEIVEYQKELFKTVSLNSLYETAHNLMTFKVAREKYDVEKIIYQSCRWLSENVFSYNTCVDILAETVGVTFFCGCEDEKPTRKILPVVLKSQNTDGGFPLFAGGKSEFHPSLLGLWALTESGVE